MCNTLTHGTRVEPMPGISRETLQSIAAMRSRKKKTLLPKIDFVSLFFILLVVLISIFTLPEDWSGVTSQHVWYYGWITAVSTGIGVLPFFFFSEPNKYWMGISNGTARDLDFATGAIPNDICYVNQLWLAG
jgi:hypothetical protein